MEFMWSGIAILIAVISYLGLYGSSTTQARSRKAQQAKNMRQVYESMSNEKEPQNKSTITKNGKSSTSSTQISQLWIYPIKSLRGCQVPRAILGSEGFYLDRRFMLLKDHGGSSRKLENMAIARVPEMCLFHTKISGNTLTVSYRAPGTSEPGIDTLNVPLEPENLDDLEKLDIVMHGSPTTAYDMGDECNKWFSKHFGFKVVMAFWGGNPRPVLGNLPGRPSNQGPDSNPITKILKALPFAGGLFEEEIIAFNDCAPDLVISESSVANVSTRLPEDISMDLTKFRANIVLKTSETAYNEDFWGELTLGEKEAKITLTGNCGRCASLNVDYASGKSGAGRDGEVLKLLQKDRRVDPGMKYSPIFGRYGFVGRGSEGMIISVGDEATVSKRNEARTRFYWPGLST